jgi:hypothetical protein
MYRQPNSNNYLYYRLAGFKWNLHNGVPVGTEGNLASGGGSTNYVPSQTNGAWQEKCFSTTSIQNTDLRFGAYSDCQNCPAGKFSMSTAATSIDTCNGMCPSNSVSGTGSSAITACRCNLGYSGAIIGQCTACIAGSYKSVMTGSCSSCASGKYSNATGATTVVACNLCDVGKYSIVTTTGHTACTDCGAGKFGSTSGRTACSTCASNFTADTGFTVCCNNASPYCGPHQYMNLGICQSCPFQSQSPPCSTAVTSCQCNPGYSGPNGGTCTACVAGKYKLIPNAGLCQLCVSGKYTSTLGDTVCQSCTGPTYQPVSSQSSCLTCPSNTTVVQSIASSISSCICNAGYMGPNGGPCTACPVSTYKSVAGLDNCNDCPNDSSSVSNSGTQTVYATMGTTD